MQTAISPSTNHVMLRRRKNVWYSVQDGNWSDVYTWMSNSLDRKNIFVPQPGDDVYLNHNVKVDVSSSINNLYISGKMTAGSGGLTLNVAGDMQATGSVDLTGSNITINLYGYNNLLTSFTSGSSSTIGYLGTLTQPVLPFNYFSLTLGGFSNGTSPKYMQANLSVAGNLISGCVLDTKGFDISVTGTTTSSTLNSTIISNTNILFTGQWVASAGHTFIISGSPTIECRGGWLFNNIASSAPNANINFTTNNQTLVNQIGGITVNNITITGAIIINNESGFSTFSRAVIINGTLNGTVSGSTLNNNGYIQFNSTATMMSTGVFNYRNTANTTVSYNGLGSQTLPFTTYENLVINGSGTKTVSGDLTINYNLNLGDGTGTVKAFDLGSNNLTVNGTTSVQGTNTGLNKTGAGTVLFIGAVTIGSGSSVSSFSGNPTVEFRGGLTLSAANFDFGTGAISFTTNNQTVSSVSLTQTFNGSITIAAGITVTLTVSTAATHIFNGVVNGASSTSILINNGFAYYNNATAPMSTGKLYCNQASNSWVYGSGNQDITPPSDPTNPGYYNLQLSGSGTTKRLLGNVSVKHTYTLDSGVTLNSNGFALTNP